MEVEAAELSRAQSAATRAAASSNPMAAAEASPMGTMEAHGPVAATADAKVDAIAAATAGPTAVDATLRNGEVDGEPHVRMLVSPSHPAPPTSTLGEDHASGSREDTAAPTADFGSPEARGEDACHNWRCLAERVNALKTGSPRPLLPKAGPAPRSSEGMPADPAAQVLRDVCGMLRVGHGSELIEVLGYVVRVATSVPRLEELRVELVERMVASDGLAPASAQLAIEASGKAKDHRSAGTAAADDENANLQKLPRLRVQEASTCERGLVDSGAPRPALAQHVAQVSQSPRYMYM